jgi:nucleotide-binding universal stress UspA family protein
MNVLIVALDAVPVEVADADVLVVAPALNSRLRHWLSDEDDARRSAQARVAAFIERLGERGVHAEGRVGDVDPLLAIADALSMFPADQIVIAARPERSTQLVARARTRFRLPTSRAGTPSLPPLRTSRTARRRRAASFRRVPRHG